VDTNVLSFIQTESQPKDLLFDASLYKSTKEVTAWFTPAWIRQCNLTWLLQLLDLFLF